MFSNTRLHTFGAVLFIFSLTKLFGQEASTAQTTVQGTASQVTAQAAQNVATLQAYQNEQLAIFHQEQTLLEGGATPEQMAAWHQQNATLFAAQLQRAEAMTVASEQQLQLTTQAPTIAANATTGLGNVLSNQATLAQSYANIHNQLLQSASSSGQPLTFSQISQIDQEATSALRQQNAALLTLQLQQAQTLTATSLQPVPTASAPLVIPANASAPMVAFLTTQHQLSQAMIQMRNQNATASPAARAAALQSFYQQNASLIAQMQQQAQALSPSSASTTP